MPTPRSEAIFKARSGDSSIRIPETLYDPQTKIDRYGVLGHVIEHGIHRYLDDPEVDENLMQITQLYRLQDRIKKDVNEILLSTLNTDAFKEHHQNLDAAQARLNTLGTYEKGDAETLIKAGVGTFMRSFSTIFAFLSSRFGPETAAHPGNWRLADHLAKLNLMAFSFFSDTYLANHEHWTELREMVEIAEDGSVQFSKGYPGNARAYLNPHDPLALLPDGHDQKDIEILKNLKIKAIEEDRPTIGCPVTFQPDTLMKLWARYATHAYRIVAHPHQKTIDDTEAFPE